MRKRIRLACLNAYCPPLRRHAAFDEREDHRHLLARADGLSGLLARADGPSGLLAHVCLVTHR
jgi:hypothetical protein